MNVKIITTATIGLVMLAARPRRSASRITGESWQFLVIRTIIPLATNTEGQSMSYRLVLSIILLTWLGYNPQALAQISDARRYCAQVKNDDAIRPLPHSLVLDAIKAENIDNASDPNSGDDRSISQMSKEDIDYYAESTVFRCMNGLFFVCNYGANIPCGGRADTTRRMPEVDRYCRQNPNEEMVPMAVTGHSNIYTWACERGKPRITDEQQLDQRGFILASFAELISKTGFLPDKCFK